MGRIVVVEDKATGKIREIDLSPPPVRKQKPVTFSFVETQSSIIVESTDITRSRWRVPRTWKYQYKNAVHQFDRPDLMRRNRFIDPPIRPLYKKGLCIYPHINHF